MSEFRNQAATALKECYTKLNPQLPQLVEAHVRGNPQEHSKAVAGENIERGRSFLFLALVAACPALPCPAAEQRKQLRIPENEFITLNLPLTLLRLGAYNTCTTHPYYLSLMQRLLPIR